jgi:hypothetical protein
LDAAHHEHVGVRSTFACRSAARQFPVPILQGRHTVIRPAILVLLRIRLWVLSLLVLMPFASQSQTASSTLDEQARTYEQATEKIRADCVAGRRIVCGRILKILPEGLVVDSGYTNLMRAPLSKSWLVPGTAKTERPENLVESKEAGAVCVGLVFVTALPRSRSAGKPRPYDYVVFQAYPAGTFTYTSVGTIRRTVRRFAGNLSTAIRMNRDLAGLKPPISTPAATGDGK